MSSSPFCSPDSSRFRQIFFPVILCVLTLAAYAQTFSCGFIEGYDDEPYITLNPIVTQGVTLQGLRWSLTTFEAGNWHPLTWWSHMLDVTMFGMNPIGHHAISLIIHAGNALLLYSFFYRITGLQARSFLVAALFSLHPLHVESVAWVAERKDVLSSLFTFGALHAYISYANSQRKAYYLAMVILFCLSLLAKPMMVTFPFLLLVLDYWPLERIRHQSLPPLLLEKIPLLLPVVAISAVSIIAQKSVGALIPLSNDSFPTRISVALNAYVVYLRKFFAPYDLASYYPYASVSGARIIIAVMALGAISVIVWRLHLHRPWLLTGWLWFLGMLVPVIGIVRVGTQSYADRYTYLPIIGVIVMLAWGGAELLERVSPGGHGKTAIAVVAIATCVTFTWNQTGFWKDGFSLYSRELAVTKGNWHAHLGLGNMLANRQRFNEAISHYDAVLVANSRSVDAHNNLGMCLRSLGRSHEALNHFLQAVDINPDYPIAHLNLGVTYADLGNKEKAIQHLQTALLIDPTFYRARQCLDYLVGSGQ